MLPCRAFGAVTHQRPRCGLHASRTTPAVAASPAHRTRLLKPGRRLPHLLLSSATGTDGTTSTASSSNKDEKIKTTMADLDALLGIQEEPAVDESKVGPPLVQILTHSFYVKLHAGQACMRQARTQAGMLSLTTRVLLCGPLPVCLPACLLHLTGWQHQQRCSQHRAAAVSRHC